LSLLYPKKRKFLTDYFPLTGGRKKLAREALKRQKKREHEDTEEWARNLANDVKDAND